jgi:glycine hydroxymethyltransferase
MHAIAAKAVAFGEALKPEFKPTNSRSSTTPGRWPAIWQCGQSHRLGRDRQPPDVGRSAAQPSRCHRPGCANWLESAGIIVNKNMIPFDERKPVHTSGLRIGTPALTTRGMGPAEMKTVADLINAVLESGGEAAALERTRGAVSDLCDQFPLP